MPEEVPARLIARHGRAMSAAGEAYAVGRISSCSGLLAEFNHAGVLAPADVHVALRLGSLGGERDETMMLAAALAVRAPRLGRVHVDLGGVRGGVAVESEADGGDVGALHWPELRPAVCINVTRGKQAARRPLGV